MISACTPTLSPTYVPAGLVPTSSIRGHESVSLRVTDKINNSAPVIEQISDLQRAGLIVLGAATGGLIGAALMSGPVTAKGVQFVCPGCAYTLQDPPVSVVHGITAAALERSGVSVVHQSDSELEVEVLRYEFVNDSGAFTVQVESAIILRAILRRDGETLADLTLLETGMHDGGMALSPSELEEFVGQTTSRAVERLLAEPALQAEI
jgi:hypothetical protein